MWDSTERAILRAAERGSRRHLPCCVLHIEVRVELEHRRAGIADLPSEQRLDLPYAQRRAQPREKPLRLTQGLLARAGLAFEVRELGAVEQDEGSEEVALPCDCGTAGGASTIRRLRLRPLPHPRRTTLRRRIRSSSHLRSP